MCQQVIDAAIGGVKPVGKIKKIIDDFTAKRSSSPEASAYELTSKVSRSLGNLYSDYASYQRAIEKEKEDKIKYGTADFARGDVESAAREFQKEFVRIQKYDFGY